jgi:hypothetical protein
MTTSRKVTDYAEKSTRLAHTRTGRARADWSA